MPTEQLPELECRADFVVSINALDHGFDFAQGVHNIPPRPEAGRDQISSLSTTECVEFRHVVHVEARQRWAQRSLT